MVVGHSFLSDVLSSKILGAKQNASMHLSQADVEEVEVL